MGQKRFLEIGKIINVHGLAGEVKVYPWCDDAAFLCSFDVLYTDKNGRNASIYVGDDNKAYSVGYPIYDSWNTVGGVEKTGYPIADAYEIDGDYYQNFTNGYVRYTQGEDLSFFPSKRVDEKGVEFPYTNSATRSRNNG